MNSEEAKWIAEHEEDVEGMRKAIVGLRHVLSYTGRYGARCAYCGVPHSYACLDTCIRRKAVEASERFVKSAVEAKAGSEDWPGVAPADEYKSGVLDVLDYVREQAVATEAAICKLIEINAIRSKNP